MSEALQLFDVAATPKLTDRQQVAYDAIAAAGWAGLHTDELGGLVHAHTGKHAATATCRWCGAAGLDVGRALRAKRLVQQRRRKAPNGDTVTVWTLTGKLQPPASDDDSFDEFPAGF